MSTDNSTTVPTRRRLSMRLRWVVTILTTLAVSAAFVAVLAVESAQAGGRHHDGRGHHQDRGHQGHHGHKGGGHDKPQKPERPADIVEDHEDVTVVCAEPLTDPATYVVTTRTWTTVTGWAWDKRSRQWVPTSPVESAAQSSQRTVTDAPGLVLPTGCTAPPVEPPPAPEPPVVPDVPVETPVPDPPTVTPPAAPEPPPAPPTVTPEPPVVTTEPPAVSPEPTPTDTPAPTPPGVELAATGPDGLWLTLAIAGVLAFTGGVAFMASRPKRGRGER